MRSLTLIGAVLLVSCSEGPTSPAFNGAVGFGITVTGASAVDLGFLEGSISGATGINDAGQIVGWSDLGTTDDHAFFVDGTTVTDMLGLGGIRTTAHAVNEVGQAVGQTRPAGSGYKGFLWDGTSMTDLGTLGTPGTSNTVARGLNNLVDVMVVGSSETTGGETHAFVWTASGNMADIHTGAVRGACSVAFDVNNSGTVVGIMNGSAFQWNATDGVQALPALVTGGYAVAFGINEAGTIVGVSDAGVDANGATFQHAVMWENGVPTDLGTLGHPNSVARAINEAGQIVGASSDLFVRTCLPPAPVVVPYYHAAFVWENGTMTDLGAISGRNPNSEALDINGSGGVVGRSNGIAAVWTIETAPSTPEEATDEIVTDVETLVAAGTVTEGRGNALLSQLDAITRQLNDGKTQVARRLLESFIKQVSGMINSGKISGSEGQALIQAAQDALDLIGA